MTEHYFPCGHKMVLGHTCPVCVNADLVAALEGIRNQVTVYPDGNAFSRNQTVKTIDNIAEAALAKAKGE